MNLYTSLSENKKQFVVLVDPDKYNTRQLIDLAGMARKSMVSYLFVGGSLLSDDNLDNTLKVIKDHCDIPVIIFPGRHYADQFQGRWNFVSFTNFG